MFLKRNILTRAAVSVILIVATYFVGGSPAHAEESRHRSSHTQTIRIDDRGIAMPDLVKGPAIDLMVRNVGVFVHELAITEVRPGTTVSQIIQAQADGVREPSSWVGDPGGINLLGSGEQVRYQRLLHPGTYVFFVPRPDSHPQLERAAYHLFRVVDFGYRDLRNPELTIALGDDAITLPEIDEGLHSYAITNIGTSPHEVFIIGTSRAADLDKVDAVAAWLEGGQVGPPPVPLHFPGGHQTIEPGETIIFTLTLRSGWTYGFGDGTTDPPHMAKSTA